MLTWASLLLVVLYSPFGSPELYSPKNYFNDNQGVVFDGEIANAQSVKNKARGGNNELSGPDYSVNTSYSRPYSNSNSGQNTNNDIGSVSSQAANNNSSANSTSGIGDANFSSSKSGKNSSSDGNSQNNGFASSTSDFSLLANNNTLRQGAVGVVNPLTDTTDPGGDPFGDPIPISDGWGFLLLLSAVYVVVKRFFLTKT